MSKRSRPIGAHKRGLSRRAALKGGALAAGAGMLALFAGRLPAYAQERRVHWLARSDFIPPADRNIEAPVEN